MLGFKLDNVIKSLKLLMFVKGSIGQNDFFVLQTISNEFI